MSVAGLPRVDPYRENEEEFAHVDILWLANLVDTINSALGRIDATIPFTAQIDVGGGGAGPIDVTVTGVTPQTLVRAMIASSSNPTTIASIVSGVNKFSITFNSDPGASAIITYVAFFTAQV